MSLFRSQQMVYCRLVVPLESAWDTLNELGKINAIHQIDQEPELTQMHRPYFNYVKRCDETLFLLQNIENGIKRFQGIINKPQNVQYLINESFTKALQQRNRAGHTFFEEIENEVHQNSRSLNDQLNNLDNITERQKFLKENYSVLLRAKELVGDSFFDASERKNSNDDAEGLKDLESKGGSLNKICGVINSDDQPRFSKMLFRLTKGNLWMKFADLDNNENKKCKQQQTQQKKRSVFFLVFQGQTGGIIHNKIIRMCDAFQVNKYDFPSTQNMYNQKLVELDSQIRESQQIITLTTNNIIKFLTAYTDERYQSQCSYIEFLKLYVIKEKAVYQGMNNLKPSGAVLVGFCWIPSEFLEWAQETLRGEGKSSNLPRSTLQQVDFPEDQTAPTFFKLNEFTSSFQQIVNTYGIPRYQEVNPGLFTIVSFPFLFGVMFGDIGHGFLLFLFGLYFVVFEKSIRNDKTNSLKGLLEIRYLLTLMGFFALYCGLIYNDFLSLRLNLFGSCFQDKPDEQSKEYAKLQNCTYPFGIDPIWGKSENELTMANSFKMKLAVILGVSQMMLGITMKAFNAIYFRQWLDFFFEFVPQITFMGIMFGYMDYLIFAKWNIDYSQFKDVPNFKYASIITTLIDMALGLGKVKTDTNAAIFDNTHGVDAQGRFQLIALVVAVLCVPLMLLPKPIILNIQNKRKHHEGNHNELNQSQNQPLIREDELVKDLEKTQKEKIHKHGAHEEFSEIFVHQIIETIEFVLGSISNTASYLRLWALSLAHSQLANVFFNKALQQFVEGGQVYGLVPAYFVFAIVTLGVLMAMDVMECFLHALRLHWVEFQNKFYKADGYAFAPLSFENSLKTQMENEESE